MKDFKHIIRSGAFTLLTILSFFACTDKNDWDVDSSYDRLFSVTKMSVSASTTDAEITWTKIPDADYYIIELSKDSLYDTLGMGESSNSIVFGEDQSIKSSPVTIDNLDSSTKYYLRMRAMSLTKESSIWSYLEDYSFNTRAEQIITDIAIGINDVTITWPANSKASHITINKNGVETDTRNLTSDEIAAGSATMTGLSGETEYTIYLMNGSIVRGSKTFTTLWDMAGAIIINPGDDIATKLTAAAEGDVFAILSGTHNVNAKIALTKTITVRGAIPGKAIIKGMSFDLAGGVGIGLRDLVLDGTDATSHLITYAEDYAVADTPALTINGCDIQNYSGGFINQRMEVAISSMTITGNLFNNIGGKSGARFIDIQKGYAKVIDIKNNTIANSISDDFIRIDDKVKDISSIITISNNTFYKACNAAGKRLIYVRLKGNSITLSKNLITNSLGLYSDQSSTNVAEMLNNYYFDAPNYLDATKKVFDADGKVVNPGFADPTNLNFTVQSNAVITAGVGDPRWLQ